MKKEISVTIRGTVSRETWKNYYDQLWIAIKEQYGYDTLERIYKVLDKEKYESDDYENIFNNISKRNN